MRDPSSEPGTPATPREKEHLERAHHEICTALTVLRSNVELVRVEMRHESDASTGVAVQGHLEELDLAVDRLRRLTAELRNWHDGEPGAAEDPAPPARRRLLP